MALRLPEGIERVLIGLSGGVDSVVLCHLLRSLNIPLQAVHINHQLSPNAASWQDFCETFCQQMDIPLITRKITVDATNTEEDAREKRYAIFREYLSPTIALVTAHHLDDQAETFLLRLCRGAGVKGLSAMQALTPMQDTWHWRPLLDMSREEIVAYANQHQLSWIEDESNQDLRYDRNYLRHEVLAKLSARWPAINKQIARSAGHCQQANALLQMLGEEDMNRCLGPNNTLKAEALQALAKTRRLNVWRTFINKTSQLPSEKRLLSIDRMLSAAADKNPVVDFGDAQIRRYQGLIYLQLKQTPHDVQRYHWDDLDKPLVIPQLGQLIARKTCGGLRIPCKNLVVSFRQGGEKIKIKNRGTKSFKKLCQELHIPPWQREQIPIVTLDDEILAIVGIAIAEPYQAADDEAGWALEFIRD